MKIAYIGRVFGCAAVFAMGASLHAQTYAFTLQPATSTATWNASFNAPFQTSGSPSSFLWGNYDAGTNPSGTRTLPGIIGPDNGQNNPIAITSGSASASGDSGSTPLHPAGTFIITLNPGDNTAAATSTTLDLLNGQEISVGANVSISFSTFRTRNPSCLIPGVPLSLPLGNADITGLTAVQQPGSAGGTLTPAGANTWNYSIPMIVNVTPIVSFNGAPVPVDPTPVPIILTGTVTASGSTASSTASTTLSNQQTQPGPFELDPFAFDEPLCSGHLVVNIVLASTTFNISSSANITASGVLVPAGCDSIDFNGDGLFPDTQDITDFIGVFGGSACPTGQCGDIDFNNDGLFPDTADIESLIRVFAGGTC